MIQTGHDSDQKKPYEMIRPLYRRTPTKPVVEGEAMYEKHSDGWEDPDDIVESQTVRNYMYWSVLSGGMGYSYGHWYVWPFVDSANVHPYADIAKLRGNWKSDYLTDEVAGQVRFMRGLIESPWYSGVPDPSLINNAGDGMSRIQAMRGRDGDYMIAYTPNGRPISANLRSLSGDRLEAFWFDPRTGTRTDIRNVRKSASVTFQPPSAADWVLVVVDAARGPAAFDRSRLEAYKPSSE